MHRIPKSAQRHIDALQRTRAANAGNLASAAAARAARKATELPRAVGPVRRLALGETPQEICNAYDVYLNGIKQRLCIIADMDLGYVKRYKAGVGNIPSKDRRGNAQTEMVTGNVQIVRKGEPLDAG